ncbi:MAG: prepilin-type N-terminal cleavage/methylation domain-containing protein [Candidatus Moranbacteria bacterium]|nr:prepilin-type N-terminal cleavage/methylation domain-containing protein [Candidatus Moranbacteria bacterium]
MKFLAKKQKGFTLIELMVSIFIFMIIISLVIEIFGKQVVASRHARVLQRNIEDADFAMNYVAKTLRTSSLPTSEEGIGNGTASGSSADQSLGTIYTDIVYAYDYSQKSCFKFAFEEEDGKGSLVVYSMDELTQENYGSGEDETFEIGKVIHTCAYDNNYSSDGRKLTSGDVTGGFYISPTRKDLTEETEALEVYDESMGKVTINLEIDNRASESVKQEEQGGIQNKVIIQTSVALRDYPGDLTF